MKLQIKNKSFTLNIEKAVELGVLTPDKVLITNIKAGDKVKHRDGFVSTIISISRYNVWLPKNEETYILAGIEGNQSAIYTMELSNKQEMIDYLNKGGYVKI